MKMIAAMKRPTPRLALSIFLSITPVFAAAQAHEGAVARAKAIVGQMSLDEKIAQLHGIHTEDAFRVVPGLARLGIPAFHVTNGPAGIGPGGAGRQLHATALPSPISLAASWDVHLARRFGEIEGSEAKALGNQLLEAPDVNIVRIPQSGRAFETYGEDPFLTSRIAVADIEGIQSEGVLANVKHYLANEQETDRQTISEIIAERPLREIYMPAFEAAVKVAHVASVMCAYPRLNGTYNCENPQILEDILRQDWKFDGFVTSDFGAVHSSVPSLVAGLDLEMPTGIFFSQLKQAVEQHEVSESLIDQALVRRFAKMIEFGLFGKQPAPKSIPIFENGRISRQIAEQSIVLLKNEGGLLPLDSRRVKSIAVIGPYAVRARSGGGGSSRVLPFYSVEPFDGIAGNASDAYQVELLDGTDIDESVAAAKRREVAIVMVGDDQGEDHDHSIELTEQQNKLVRAVAEANPRTIVVLKSGAAVTMPWLDKIHALIEAWYPGEEDGNAVASVIFGDVNPSGKLPISFPASVNDTLARNPEQYPGDHHQVHYSEGLDVGYRWFQSNHIKPLFPFGFGLSYTDFKYSDLHIEHDAGSHSAAVTLRVTNTGKLAGAEVVELYLGFPPIPEGDEAQRQLKGFQKVMLRPMESKSISIPLDPRSFSYWSINAHDWKIANGNFKVMIGSSSEDIRLEGVIDEKGSPRATAGELGKR
jgi:beta-glucosidase